MLVNICFFEMFHVKHFYFVFRFYLKNDGHIYKVLFLLRALCYNEMKYF